MIDGELPARTFPIILCNDLIWWYPFSLYLLRRAPRRSTIVVMAVVAVHVAASLLLVIAREGTDAQPDLASRAAFIAGSQAMWVVCWFLWVVASLGLMTFFVLWSLGLSRAGAPRCLLLLAGSIALAGLACDLASEWIHIAVLTDWRLSREDFAEAARLSRNLGPGFGNGLYCVAGLFLSVMSRQVGFQRRLLLAAGLAVWICGLLLSVAAFVNHAAGILALGSALMGLFLPWASVTAAQLSNVLRSNR